MKLLLSFSLLITSLFAQAADLSQTSQQEIAHLIHYLESSGCQFNRNGTWYPTAEAVNHINKKYQYLLDKKLVSSAEIFIEKAASESSMSGKAYLVQCGGNTPQASGAWFTAELVRFRQSNGAVK